MRNMFGYYCKKQVAYKYRSFESNSYTNTLALLEEGEVFFSPPALFNDLYDTRLPVSSVNKKKLEVMAREIENARKSDIAIFCLSEVYDSIPMWTYYGGNNAGICIGLRLSKLSNGYFGLKLKNGEVVLGEDFATEPIPAYQVHYNKSIPNYMSLDTYERDIKTGFVFLFNKPKQLEQEKEIRVVVPRKYSKIEWPEKEFKGNVYHLEKGVIESIYLGPAFNYTKFDVIKSLITRSDTACSGASLYQIVPDRKYYRYERKEIPYHLLDDFQEYMISESKRIFDSKY